jgi:hypothetical protein
MTRWVTTTQPSALLTQEPGPVSTDKHGSEVVYFRTAFGKRFARITETSGFVFWMREVE